MNFGRAFQSNCTKRGDYYRMGSNPSCFPNINKMTVMSWRMMLAAASEWMSATIENRLMVHARFPSTGSNTFHHFSSFRNIVPPLAHFVIAFLALAALVRTTLGPLLPINSLLPDFPTRAKPSCLL